MTWWSSVAGTDDVMAGRRRGCWCWWSMKETAYKLQQTSTNSTDLQHFVSARLGTRLVTKPSLVLWNERHLLLDCFTCNSFSTLTHTYKVISKHRHRVSYHVNHAPWNSSTLTDIIVQHTKYRILCKHWHVTWLTTWLLWDFWEVRSTSSLSNEVHYTCVVLGRCSRFTYWLYTHRQNTQKLQRNCKQITQNLQRWQTADVQKLSMYT